ncbi:uncharacterized protein LOC125077979 [Vanessa atalanta]|uniref:uncharacterized protein LOC125077979 n=1 Tax=Vanessa atalanta TaxID=42275 RepID=UPI001FCD5DAB|nr:uncharacterized protein LOC125077979 [Vanessa atalanta]
MGQVNALFLIASFTNIALKLALYGSTTTCIKIRKFASTALSDYFEDITRGRVQSGGHCVGSNSNAPNLGRPGFYITFTSHGPVRRVATRVELPDAYTVQGVGAKTAVRGGRMMREGSGTP